MGKRKEKKAWQVIGESIYRSDRDTRIKRAYEIANPEIMRQIPQKNGGEQDGQKHSVLCSGIK